jgi:hypothetical protein
MTDSIWQCPALYENNPRAAAEEFARTYSSKPHLIAWFRGNRFQFVDGVRVYSISLQAGNEAFPALYKIYIEED